MCLRAGGIGPALPNEPERWSQVTDPRYEKLAKVLVDYCLDVQKKDLVLIRAGLPSAPLVRDSRSS